MAKFEIKKSTNNEYYFNLMLSGENVVSLRSELYTTKSSCENGIESVKANAPLNERYEKRNAVNGKYYFNLKAVNGQVIGTSRMYNTDTERDRGISAVKIEAPLALITDLS